MEPVMRDGRPTAMERILLAVTFLSSLVACGGTNDAGSPRAEPLTFQRLVGDPGDYDGRSVRIETGYLSSFEISVLTSGFAESYPPQATEPQIWLEAPAPRGDCIERAQGTTWSERVIATGAFRYRADGGLGHLGAYDMALEDATLACV